MSTIVELGFATTTTARVVVRSDVAGVVQVIGAGSHGYAYADPAINDGIVAVDLSGLTPGQRYPVDIKVGGISVDAAIVQAMPDSGPFGVVFTTCHGALRGWPHADWLRSREQRGEPRIVSWVKQGDYPYLETNAWESNQRSFGQLLRTFSSRLAAGDTDAELLECIRAHYRQVRLLPGHREVSREIPGLLDAGDDHRYSGDNAYGKIPDAPSAGDWDEILNASGTPGQGGANKDGANLPQDAAAYRRMISLCDTVQQEWAIGNPPNPAVNSDPRNARSWWYSHRIGGLEIFVIEMIGVRDLKTKTAPRYCMGSDGVQYAWLKQALIDSTAKFKAIASPKPFWEYSDGWDLYAERDDFENFIDRAVNGGNPDGWATPGGVFMMCGDMHYPYIKASQKLSTFGVGPTTQTFHVLPNGYGGNSIYRATGYQSNTGDRITGLRGAYNNCVVVDVYDEYAEISLRRPHGGIGTRGRIYAGSNAYVGVAVQMA